jgi:predicted helicase
MGSQAPVAISLLVKNPKAKERGRIYLRDVGDFLTREEKLATVATFGSVAGITEANGWTRIMPDAHGDWVKQRDESFGRHLTLGSKEKNDVSPRLFANYSLGVVTNRDAWTYSPSKRGVGEQMARMIAFYNAEVARFDAAHPGLEKKAREVRIDGFIETDPTKIAWTRALKNELAKGSRLAFTDSPIVPGLYRPFSKHWLYFDRKLNEMVYQMPRLFPHAGVVNRVIGVSASESMSSYSVLMADLVPGLKTVDMVGSQFFPLYLYEAEGSDADDAQTSLTASPKKTPPGTARRDGITDAGLAHFAGAYPGETLTKEDVFYYVYGVLHSADYRERYDLPPIRWTV